MDRYAEANRRLWDEWTGIHQASEFYDVEGFKAGRDTLWPLESEQVGDVRGKSMLHLQCHFGMDTMSWARRGARVTGADFSERAIELARSLAAETGIDATFVCANVLELDEALEGTFDVVYTGGGAICWLDDLAQWGRIVAGFLAPAGTFYIREFHPFAYVFADESLTVAYPYFPTAEPLEFPVQGSYAQRDAVVQQKVNYNWAHPLEEVFGVLIDAGLSIRSFREYSYVREQLFEWTVQGADGMWRAPDGNVPLMFSIKATKD